MKWSRASLPYKNLNLFYISSYYNTPLYTPKYKFSESGYFSAEFLRSATVLSKSYYLILFLNFFNFFTKDFASSLYGMASLSSSGVSGSSSPSEDLFDTAGICLFITR